MLIVFLQLPSSKPSINFKVFVKFEIQIIQKLCTRILKAKNKDYYCVFCNFLAMRGLETIIHEFYIFTRMSDVG